MINLTETFGADAIGQYPGLTSGTYIKQPDELLFYLDFISLDFRTCKLRVLEVWNNRDCDILKIPAIDLVLDRPTREDFWASMNERKLSSLLLEQEILHRAKITKPVIARLGMPHNQRQYYHEQGTWQFSWRDYAPGPSVFGIAGTGENITLIDRYYIKEGVKYAIIR